MVRVGFVTTAHVHVPAFVSGLRSAGLRATPVGLWDHDAARGAAFCERFGLTPFESRSALLDACDAVIVGSENVRHGEDILAGLAAGCHVLCEKPLVITEDDAAAVRAAVAQTDRVVMTAFPCRFSPAWAALKERVAAGAIGTVRAICATNRGTCPGGWFTDPALSGGGAMIDHTVHVADLLWDLLGQRVVRVNAQTGSNVYGQAWDDTAMLTLEYADGTFATLDSSWSRPGSYKTWGDVTMTVTGDLGTIELDMFGQEVHRYGVGGHSVAGYGTNLDAAMIDEFLSAIEDRRAPRVTAEDGLRAAAVALAGYRSVREGQTVSIQ